MKSFLSGTSQINVEETFEACKLLVASYFVFFVELKSYEYFTKNDEQFNNTASCKIMFIETKTYSEEFV